MYLLINEWNIFETVHINHCKERPNNLEHFREELLFILWQSHTCLSCILILPTPVPSRLPQIPPLSFTHLCLHVWVHRPCHIQKSISEYSFPSAGIYVLSVTELLAFLAGVENFDPRSALLLLVSFPSKASLASHCLPCQQVSPSVCITEPASSKAITFMSQSLTIVSFLLQPTK